MPIRAELRHHYRTAGWQAARAAVRERAGDRCERCGAANGSRVWIYGSPGHESHIQCGCAHVNGIAGDDRLENLRWWCRGCHLHHDRPQHRETRAERKDRARPLLAAPTY